MNISYLTDCINEYSKVSYHCIITGDFNCPDVNWTEFKAPNDGVQDALLECTIANGFSQLVLEPTRGKNILDIVLSNH